MSTQPGQQPFRTTDTGVAAVPTAPDGAGGYPPPLLKVSGTDGGARPEQGTRKATVR